METPDVLGPTAADASVRPAAAADVSAIGAVHARAWRSAYATLLDPAVVAALDGSELADAWLPAVTAPPSPAHRVLVACSGPTVVGFAATEPGGEIVTLLVDPPHQRRGHGSRLLSAAVDLLRSDGISRVRTWCPVADVPRREFLLSAGFGDDGARRRLSVPGGRGDVDEVRMAAEL